ncbi:hypothetical protein CFter6_2461 [Collimonas fungivorans]|uniref:Uncharacterized protein n=1 Tax=Collimonas fungivorans TaxID=158899 RepID=A0A127PBK4_9BURK|nr:hypothetical protein [Collimonas fungivorans]AMO95133.1 hypothetical protein CFter6_2461 [Collimonas fungivorans]
MRLAQGGGSFQELPALLAEARPFSPSRAETPIAIPVGSRFSGCGVAVEETRSMVRRAMGRASGKIFIGKGEAPAFP